MKKTVILTCLLLTLSLAGAASAAVLIDLDASGLSEGDLTGWTNAGTAGGTFFTADRPDDAIADPNALVTTIDGKKGVLFTDGAWMESDVTTPAVLTGANSPWTVMIWAYGYSGTGIATWEDCLFQMADRGGNTAHFNIGGLAFTGWNDITYLTQPPRDQWVHIAWTYDGANVRIYINGLPDAVSPKSFNFRDGDLMRIARAMPDQYGTHPYTGAIASIQVHNEALSRGQVQNAMGAFVEAGSLSPTGLSLKEGNGSGNITLQLQANNTTGQGPTEDLEITLSFAGTYADASLGTSAVGEPYVINVPAATYSNPIIIPIMAEDDYILEGTHRIYVQAVVTAGDPAYQAATILPAAGLAITIVDNDYAQCPEPAFSNGSYIDEFNCLWDFTVGTTGMWDGMLNAGNINVANTVDSPGKLRIQSTGDWNGNLNAGPFLYTEVTGDFIAEIHLDAPTANGANNGGLMVRLGGDSALGGAGEDNMYLAWMTSWNVGSIFWPVDNGNRPELDITWEGADAHSYFRVERRGAEFYWSRSYDGVNWDVLESANPMVRSDMDVATLQVGLVHSHGGDGGSVQYDYFKLTPSRGSISGTVYLTESEGDTGMLQFQLDTQGAPAPLDDISVTFSAAAVVGADPNSDPNDILIGTAPQGTPYTYVIPAAQYAQSHSIQITAVADAIPEPDQELTLVAKVASTDPNWNELFIASDARIHIFETPGLFLDTQGQVTVYEGGDSDTFSVRLKIAPLAPVTVALVDQSNPAQVALDPAVLNFDGSNWNIPQSVTVTAVDDALLETDPHAAVLTLTATNGSEYDALDPVSVPVSIYENECGAWGYLWADLDQDCDVDITDLSELAAEWLVCTNPYDPGCVDMR
jgi:hypothetical protein